MSFVANCELMPVTAASKPARTKEPIQSLVLLPTRSFVKEPHTAPKQLTIEFAKVSRSRRSVDLMPRLVYLVGKGTDVR